MPGALPGSRAPLAGAVCAFAGMRATAIVDAARHNDNANLTRFMRLLIRPLEELRDSGRVTGWNLKLVSREFHGYQCRGGPAVQPLRVRVVILRKQVGNPRVAVGPKVHLSARKRSRAPSLVIRSPRCDNPPTMALSARNQFPGKVLSIKGGAVMSEVVIDIGGGHQIVSLISTSSVKRLKLKKGGDAVAVIKATEVIVSTGGPDEA